MSIARQNNQPQTAEACREVALRLLERKPHSVADLRRKLFKRHFSKQIIDPILNDLQRAGLLDDLALSRSYCEYRLNASPPIGRHRVQQELSRHGILPEIARQALAEVWDAQTTDEIRDKAGEAARRKLRLIGKNDNHRRKQEKLYRYLAGRGFATEVIKDTVRKILEEDIDNNTS